MATSVVMSAATPCLWGTAPGWGRAFDMSKEGFYMQGEGTRQPSGHEE